MEQAAQLAGMVEAAHDEMGVGVFPIAAPRLEAALAMLGDHPRRCARPANSLTADSLAEVLASA